MMSEINGSKRCANVKANIANILNLSGRYMNIYNSFNLTMFVILNKKLKKNLLSLLKKSHYFI